MIAKEMIDAIMPDFMKHFSVGSSCGMAVAFGLSLWFEPIITKIMFILFMFMAGVGLYNLKDDYIEYFKK